MGSACIMCVALRSQRTVVVAGRKLGDSKVIGNQPKYKLRMRQFNFARKIGCCNKTCQREQKRQTEHEEKGKNIYAYH